MSTFQVPFSSSPPSTPDKSSKQNRYDSSSYIPSHPSTTPAGPPPSSICSFTPVEPPPPSMLGSSRLGSGKFLYKSSTGPSASSRSQKRNALKNKSISLSRDLEHSSRLGLSNGTLSTLESSFNVYTSKASRATRPSSRQEGKGLQEPEDQFQEEGGIDQSSFIGSLQSPRGLHQHHYKYSSPARSAKGSSAIIPGNSLVPSSPNSIMPISPRGIKRSRGGAMISVDPKERSITARRYVKDSYLSRIAQNMAAHLEPATLAEDDEFILHSEELMDELNDALNKGQSSQQDMQSALITSSEGICTLWATCLPRELNANADTRESLVGIGPKEEAPPLQKAAFISILLLSLHHPPAAKGKQAPASSLYRTSIPPYGNGQTNIVIPTAMPKVLIDWLDKYHNPWRTMYADIDFARLSPPSHYNFWDMVFVLTLRGRLKDAIHLLEKADFRYAETAPKDGQTGGYTEEQIDNIHMAVGRAAEVLQRCPATVEDDWRVSGSDWAMFRKLVEHALDDLVTFAEGRDQATEDDNPAFASTSLALSSNITSFSHMARRAESRIPWTVYQSLRVLYGILLGSETEMLASAQDWVEATIGLTVWWNGDNDKGVSVEALAKSKHSLKTAQSKSRRLVDVDYDAAYLDRLRRSFRRATDENNEEDFQINSNNSVEVGLACVFEDDFEGIMGLLRGWSLPVTAVVAEIATLGGWFSISSSAPDHLMKNFDESDLMVLSTHRPEEPALRRDKILVDYANALYDRGSLHSETDKVVREGWQLSVAALMRIGDTETSRIEINKVLSKASINSDAMMDSIFEIFWRYGMHEEGYALAEKYADSIVETSDRYGTALIYYARAHSKQKVKNVCGLLVSMALLRSAAFPPASSIDTNLKNLVYDPASALGQLSLLDKDAAEILHNLMSGYATLRQFYDLRDEEPIIGKSKGTGKSMDARKREALIPLLAVIGSASANLAGGLFDKDGEAIVQVDGLLALLGEALPFMGQSEDLLDLSQCNALAKATENLQTVSDSIYQQCDKCVQSTLASFHGLTLSSSPRKLLKTMSSGPSASSFSLLGSSMHDQQPSAHLDAGINVMDGPHIGRGWDWRAGVAREAKGEDVLRILRLRLAREMAKHWN